MRRDDRLGSAAQPVDAARGGAGWLHSARVSQWVRPLSQSTSAAAQWHAPQIRSYTTTTYCGKVLEGSIEVASDEKAEREGRCSSCATRLAAREGTAQKVAPRPVAQTPTSPVKKAAVKKTAKTTTAKKSVGKPGPKGSSRKAPVAKRPVRRSPRGKA